MQIAKKPLRNRSWPRFSLATALCVLTALCLWLGGQVQTAHQQRYAAQIVKKHRGSIRYDWHTTDEDRTAAFRKTANMRIPAPAFLEGPPCCWSGARAPMRLRIPAPAFLKGPPGPEWCRNLIGDEYFQKILRVTLLQTALEPAEVREISKLSTLEDLYISGLTDSDLEHISKLSNLRHLGLSGSLVTDEGILKLRTLTKLQSLDLTTSQVTEAGERNLKAFLPSCKVLLVVPADLTWARKLFDKYDADKDDNLVLAEWEYLVSGTTLLTNFAKVDTDQNRRITVLELARWATRTNWRNRGFQIARVGRHGQTF